MPSGIQQQLGIGQSQVLPPSESNPMRVVELYQQNKDRKVNQQRYDDRQKEQSEKELYGILGDALNPRNFNQAIHGKILQAQRDLAQKIKSGTPSYGDTYIMAQNKAAELGSLSQQLNNADQQIALTKKEYEFDKRINSGAIEMAARKRILDELNRTGKIDETINYYDEAANDNPDIALIDKSGYTFTDFRPEEKQPLEFDIKKRSAVGKTNQYKWKMDNYPAYYDVIQKGDYEAPEVRTRSEMIKDANGNEVPALSEEAYRRFSLTPSNVFAINQRLKSRYGDKLNLRSEQAETLRRIEAFKDVERNKPIPKESIVEQLPLTTINNTTNVNTGNKGPAPIDLREYKDVTGGKDITDLMRGVKVTGLPNGSSLLAESVVYDPIRKVVTYKEYTDGKDAAPKSVSLTKFKQDIKTLNPQIDMKFLDGLENPITGNKEVPQPAAKKEISRKDISAKASAAGYSVKEYEALLKKNGVTIKD